jgi:hypothetical protein
VVGRWEFRHIDHFGTRRLGAIHCRDHRVHCYGDRTSTVSISQAGIALAVVVIGVALVWATPRLDRFARRFAAPGMRLPSTPFYTPWRWWMRMVGLVWIGIGLLLMLQATNHLPTRP